MTVFAVSMGSVEGEMGTSESKHACLDCGQPWDSILLESTKGPSPDGQLGGALAHIGSNCFQHAAGTGGHIGDDASDAGAEDGRCEEALLPPLLTHELGADQRG